MISAGPSLPPRKGAAYPQLQIELVGSVPAATTPSDEPSGHTTPEVVRLPRTAASSGALGLTPIGLGSVQARARFAPPGAA